MFDISTVLIVPLGCWKHARSFILQPFLGSSERACNRCSWVISAFCFLLLNSHVQSDASSIYNCNICNMPSLSSLNSSFSWLDAFHKPYITGKILERTGISPHWADILHTHLVFSGGGDGNQKPALCGATTALGVVQNRGRSASAAARGLLGGVGAGVFSHEFPDDQIATAYSNELK